MSAPPAEKPKKRVHPVDEVLPHPKLATYGFQHVVAFYAGAVLVPILIAGAIDLPAADLVKLITADLFTCGIASIIQAVGFWKVGVRLPLLRGVTFAGVSPIIAIGLAHGGGVHGQHHRHGRDRRQADQGLRHRQRAARRRPGNRDRRHLQLVPVHGILRERRTGPAHRCEEPMGGRGRGRHHDHPGLLPKVAAIVSSIPNPVLGGSALTLFATVAVVGIQTLGKVDFTDHRNLIIVTTSLALALWVTSYPDVARAMPSGIDLLFGSGISIGAIAAILLNVVFFHLGSRGPRVAGGGTISLDEVNSMTGERFTEVFGHVVQDVPWAVQRAFERRPYVDTKALREAFQDSVLTGSSEQQLEMIRSFPDLGARAGGRPRRLVEPERRRPR